MMNNNARSEATTTTIPKWIFFFGCLLILIGMGSGFLGVFSPTQFFSDFPSFTGWDQMSYVTTGWGIRNLAMGVAMIIALFWLKTPSAIGVVFSMRFITETSDLLNSLFAGHGTLGLPLIALAVGWIFIFLVPEALAARWGLSAALKNKA